MNKRIVSFVKYNKFVLWLYRLFGNFGIAILKIFIRVKKNRILFMSFGGQKYDDSPKVLYEKIKDDPFFKDYELVWTFSNIEKFDYVEAKKVKTDSFAFYKLALSSKIWINNSSVERGLRIRRKKQIEFNTWHGTPLKTMGNDKKNSEYKFKQKKKNGQTIYCSQSEYDREIFTRLFNTDKENIILSDLPRNDELVNQVDTTFLKQKLNIPLDKKVILYAPTFREYCRDKFNSCYIKPPIDLTKWQEKLGDEYVLLFRAHYEVVNVLGIEDNGFVYNFSSYPCLNDLILVSDLLISDYSSIYFDYAITKKPMFNFSYDLDEYEEKRGLYLNLEEVLPCNVNFTEDDLLNEIKTFNKEEYFNKTSLFKERFAPYAGSASQVVIDKIKEKCN